MVIHRNLGRNTLRVYVSKFDHIKKIKSILIVLLLNIINFGDMVIIGERKVTPTLVNRLSMLI